MISTRLYLIIDFLVFFGGILAICLWQLRDVDKRAKARAAAKAAREADDAGTGDIPPEGDVPIAATTPGKS